MNLFTVNQVNQVYVAKARVNAPLTKNSAEGDVYVGTAKGVDNCNKAIYIQHKGPGGVTRSDLIDIDKILYATITKASEMAKKLKEYRLKLSADAMDADDNTKVIKGQDFILRIKLDHYIGISPEDSEYWKYGMVHTGPNMNVTKFWTEMAKSILRNMTREAVKLVSLYPITTSNSTDSVDNTKELDLTNVEANMAHATGLAIREVEPDWVLGLKQQKIMHIEVTPVAFEYDGTTLYWADGQSYDKKLEPVDSGVTIPNGKLTADYEYFFHGERGDQYRMVGWPDYIPTKYMVDESKQYDYLQIHFYYRGDNEAVQKSEKDITLLCVASEDPLELGVAGEIQEALKGAGVPVDAWTSVRTTSGMPEGASETPEPSSGGHTLDPDNP